MTCNNTPGSDASFNVASTLFIGCKAALSTYLTTYMNIHMRSLSVNLKITEVSLARRPPQYNQDLE